MASARDVARKVLRRVEQGEAYASLALDGELARARLSDADRGLATEIVYGVLRHRARLDRALEAHAERRLKVARPVLVALRVAAYQILFLRVPSHAAVDDAVGAVRRLGGGRIAGFANAVLRKLAEGGEPPLPPPEDLLAHLEAAYSLPGWIAERVVAGVGPGEAVVAADAFTRSPVVALRVSLGRADRQHVMQAVATERPHADLWAAPYLPEGFWMRSGGSPESLAAFQEGKVTVQDVAAQLVGRLCGARPGERILDACAGVGGKSTHLAELCRAAGGTAEIHAADLSERKLDLLSDAVRRLRLEGIRPIRADLTSPSAPLADEYDRILLDAPCTGLGVLRRHPESKWRLSPSQVAELAALQARLLDALSPRVRPGGLLCYSVCTFTEEEGPAQVDAFLSRNPDYTLEPPPPHPSLDVAPFLDDRGRFRSWPHRHDTDAFFCARLRRGA